MRVVSLLGTVCENRNADLCIEFACFRTYIEYRIVHEYSYCIQHMTIIIWQSMVPSIWCFVYVCLPFCDFLYSYGWGGASVYSLLQLTTFLTGTDEIRTSYRASEVRRGLSKTQAGCRQPWCSKWGKQAYQTLAEEMVAHLVSLFIVLAIQQRCCVCLLRA